jgi:hypothetical protein
MDFGHAVEKIVSRVNELSTSASFTYDEVNKWMKISSGDDLLWAYDRPSDQLTIDHSICLELEKDRV